MGEIVTIYTYHNNANTKKLRKYFEENNCPYQIRNIESSPLSFEEFKSILARTDDGAEDILADGSDIYRRLVKEGVVFDDMRLSELHEMICKYFKLFKVPTVVQGWKLKTGSSQREMRTFLPKGRMAK